MNNLGIMTKDQQKGRKVEAENIIMNVIGIVTKNV